MAGNAAQLQARIAAIDAALASLTPYQGVDLPNSQGGGSTDWVGYRKSLLEERKQLREELSISSGPFELETRMP